MSEGGGLHGNSKYFHAADPKNYIRLQVIESTSAYVKIHASLVSIKDAEKNSERLGFTALFDSSNGEVIGVVSSVEEIDEFLDGIWAKWQLKDNSNLGSWNYDLIARASAACNDSRGVTIVQSVTPTLVLVPATKGRGNTDDIMFDYPAKSLDEFTSPLG